MTPMFTKAALKSLVAASAVAATVLSPIAAAPAAADGWGHPDGSRNFYRNGGNDCFWNHGERYCQTNVRPRNPRPVGRHDDGGAVVAGAILGIAGAAILAGALTQPAPPPPRQYYVAPNAYPPAPAYSGPKVITYESTLEPWTPAWYDWCDQRYRSFNPQSGTFRGYDGRDHFCVPN